MQGPAADGGETVGLARSRLEAGAARRLLPSARSRLAVGRLCDLATSLLGAGSAQVSLLSDVQTVAGGAGGAAAAVGSESPLAESLCTVTVAGGVPLVVEDAPRDPRVAALPPVVSGAVGSYLGVPLRSEIGVTVGALCVFDPASRTWKPGDVRTLEQLAAAVIAELELGALAEEYESARAHWELAVEAAGIGGFEFEVDSDALAWDDRLLEVFGYDRESFDGTAASFYARVLPEDADRVRRTVEAAVERVGGYEVEYRILHPSNGLRWIQAHGRVLADEEGRGVRVLGAALDTTALRDGQARLDRVMESMSAAFISIDRQWSVTYLNSEAERVLGMARHDLVGRNFWEIFPAAVGTEFDVVYHRAAETGEPATLEAYYPAPLEAWYDIRVSPSADGLSLYFLDVTERRAAQARLERAAVRSALIADVTSALTGTFDAEVAAGLLAERMVPALADWCVVSLVDDDEGPIGQRIRDVAWSHAEPDLRPAVERYARHRVEAMLPSSYLNRALVRDAPIELLHDVVDAACLVLSEGIARDQVIELAPDYALLLPLRAHDRTLGLLSLFRGAASGPLSREDVQTASEVASRAGLALDNARLYSQQRLLAEALQRSLLTEPPQPDHGQIVVRYTPAAAAAQVGGDWYDAFLQSGGATTLVIGDVVGHDTAAAAAMGQVRGLLRGIAATTGDGPAGVLRRLDEALHLLQIETTATAVVLRLEQTDDERASGVTRVRWSNAGHPPPMALTADGRVTVLGGAVPDPLLGVVPGTTRNESEATLARGATVLLYTDGLVEQRGQPLDEGLDRLHDALVALAGRDLDELCDEVLVRLLPDAPEDDVALVAVRLHQQDRPRPPEAGPTRVPAGM